MNSVERGLIAVSVDSLESRAYLLLAFEPEIPVVATSFYVDITFSGPSLCLDATSRPSPCPRCLALL
jgi:hypothetical protein